MKKITYVILTLSALFVNSHALAVEARIPVMSFSKALESAKNKNNFANLKSAKFNVKEKLYNITYITKDGKVDTVKISLNGKEVQ